jgi:hypothetical protein
MVVFESPTAHPTICMKLNNTAKDAWLVDSCASFHLTPQRSAYVQYRNVPKEEITPEDIFIDANRKPSHHTGIGTIILQVDNGTMTIKDVRYVPHLASNLISLGLLKKQGFDTKMEDSEPSAI